MPVIAKIRTKVNRAREWLGDAVAPRGMMLGRVLPRSGVMGYSAGKLSLRDPDFTGSTQGPNAKAEAGGLGLGQGGLWAIRARVTELMDENEIIDGAVESKIDHEIHTGIDDVQPKTPWPEVNKALSLAWRLVARKSDPSRLHTLGQQQAQARRELERTGEIGVRPVIAPPLVNTYGRFRPMPALELIEAERIPLDLTGKVPEGMTGAGNEVRQGVETNQFGQVVAYWVLKSNPTDAWFSAGMLGWVSWKDENLERVPASEMALCFNTRRVGQKRGVPQMVSVMRMIRHDDGFTDDTMLSARVAATCANVLEAPNAEAFKPNSNGKTPLMVDAAGNPVSTIRGPGFLFIKPGTKFVQTIASNLPGANFESAIRLLLRRISRVLRTTYERISGDYSQTTFSSSRAATLDVTKGVQRAQVEDWGWCGETLYRMTADWACAVGLVKLTDEMRAELEVNPELLYTHSINAPGQGQVNRFQESQANQTDVASGFASKVQVIGESGRGWKDIIAEEVEYEVERRRQYKEAGLGDPPPLGRPGGAAGGGNGGGGGSGGSGDGGGDGSGEDPEDQQRQQQQQNGGSGDETAEDRIARARAALANGYTKDEVHQILSGHAVDDRRRRLGLNGSAKHA